MKVKELITLLSELDQEKEIQMAGGDDTEIEEVSQAKWRQGEPYIIT